jgi:hypothetical protein
MDVVAHDYPYKYLKTFFLLAVFQAVYDHVTIDFSCEDIYPVNHLESKKMWFALILYLVTSWHISYKNTIN